MKTKLLLIKSLELIESNRYANGLCNVTWLLIIGWAFLGLGKLISLISNYVMGLF